MIPDVHKGWGNGCVAAGQRVTFLFQSSTEII